jgi:type IV pilus assembly protein PilM
MASSNVCWGIEIGAAAIKAIKLENTGDGTVRVLEYANIVHPKPLSTPDVNPNDVLRVSLGALASQHDLSKSQIAISVPGHSAFARFAKLPPVEPKKVPDIVKFEAMQQIPFPLEQVEWDYQTFVTPDSPDVEVGIFAITRERVMERLSMLADVGITPNYVVLSPIAVYNALAYDLGFDTKTSGTIIVDVGTTSTDLVIATPGRMWIRTFPIGGHQFTEALVQQFNLSYPKAEKLKREAEDSKHARQVFQAMRPVFTNLTQDIQRSIGYYQSLNRDAELSRLIGVGSTFLLPGLRKYLKQQLSMDIYRVEEFKKLKADGDALTKINQDSLMYCTAYGLALQGLGLNAVGGNLMPVSVLRKSMWKEKVPYFGIAAGIALATGAAMFALPLRDSMAAAQTTKPPIVSEVQRTHGELKKEADAAGVLGDGGADMKAANMVAVLDKRTVFQHVYSDVQSMLAASNGRIGTWASEQKVPPAPEGPAYVVNSISTNYLPPSGEPPAAPADASVVVDPMTTMTAYPRIEVTMIADTTQPEARKFVEATVVKWLQDNKLRSDTPFEIVAAKRPFTIAEGGAEAPPDVPSNNAGTGDGGSVRPSEMEDIERRPGRGRPGSRRMVTADGTVGEVAEGAAGTVVVGGAGGPQVLGAGGQDVSKRSAEAAAEVNTLANLAELRPKTPSAPVSSVRVVWYAVFKPPAPPVDPAATGGAQ